MKLIFSLQTMASNSATDHFGSGLDTSPFLPSTPNSKGQLRCCVGPDRSTYPENAKFFGVIKDGEQINPEIICFCEYCANKSFTEDKLYKITSEEHGDIIQTLICSAYNIELCRPYVGDIRSVRTRYIKFNINVTDKEDNNWSPITKGTDVLSFEAEKGGVLLADVPTFMYWEFVVKANDIEDGIVSKYYDEKYYFKVSAEDGNGRKIKICNQDGNENYYTPMVGGQVKVNSFGGGIDDRFFFQAPSQLEIDNSLQASHNNESNKIFITVDIYEKFSYESQVLPSSPPLYRGSGSGLTRGSNSKYTGGSNFSAAGNGYTVKTTSVRAYFKRVDTDEGIIQIVNSESEEERIYMTKKVQVQVDTTEREVFHSTTKGNDNVSEYKPSKRSEMLKLLI